MFESNLFIQSSGGLHISFGISNIKYLVMSLAFIIQEARSIQPYLYFYSVNHPYCCEYYPWFPCVFLMSMQQWYHYQHILGLIFILLIHSQLLWNCIGRQQVQQLMALNHLTHHLVEDQYLEVIIAYLDRSLEYLQISTLNYLIS